MIFSCPNLLLQMYFYGRAGLVGKMVSKIAARCQQDLLGRAVTLGLATGNLLRKARQD